MRKLNFRSILFFLIILSFHVQGQKYANNWVFGNSELNFSGGSAEVTRTFAEHLNRGMGVISDVNGALLFYTDGYSVWNKNHQAMPNGTNLIPSDQSTSTQQSLVIPKPGSSTVFYIFTIDPWNGQTTSGLYYSEVDIQLDGGLGDVVVKGIKLISQTTNKLSATLHKNQKDVWVLTHENNSNKYSALMITEQGISNVIQTFNLGPAHSFWQGQMKFSPDGKYVATSYENGVILFDFDSSTGTLSNPMNFSFSDIESSAILDGLDFSSDATKMYVAEWRSHRIYQFDLQEYTLEKIRDSRTPIGNSFIFNLLRQFQLAPDGKIYITKGGGGGGTEYLGVIDNPNASSGQVNFSENGLYLEGGDSFVNFTPSFIQNYFFKTSFRYDNTCEDELVKFTITNEHLLDSVKWFFGEGSSSDLRQPEFQYANPGIYTVTMLAYYQTKPDTIKQTLVIYPKTSFDFGPDASICSGSKIGIDTFFESYVWNTGDTTSHIRILDSGWYSLTNTNNFGCSYSDSIFVTVKPLPVINLPDTVALDEKGTAVLSPGTFHSYEWNIGGTSPSLTVNETGWYSVLVTSEAGCVQTKSIFISDQFPVATNKPADWIWLNPKPTGDAGLDVHFIDDQTGFILTRKEILRTTDGGDSWEVQMKVPYGNKLTFSGVTGYIIGNNGSLYKSTHRGGGWNKMPFEFIDNLNTINAIGDTLLVTSASNLFVSKNGGASWSKFSINGFSIKDAFFTTSKIGHATTNNGIVMTTDGGASWNVTSSNMTSDQFNRIYFVNKDVGYSSRGFGDIYKTSNGGLSWSLVAPYLEGEAIHFINQDTGFVAGEHGAIYKTINGGLTWSWSGFNGLHYQDDLHDIQFVDENLGFATGFRGRIIKTTNGGLTWKEYAATYGMINQIKVGLETTYALAGNEFIKTPTGESSWKKIGAPISGIKCGGFDFINKNVGFALIGGSVGTSGTTGMVYKTLDGGVSWERTHTSYEIAGEDLTCIKFLDENVGFVSGGFNSRAMRKTTDGGKTWTVVAPFHANKIQFVNELVGFACGERYSSIGKIYKTSDAGNTWQLVFQRDNEITSLHFVNESIGYAVGERGKAFKTLDGGTSWLPLDVPYEWYLDVKFYSEKFGFILTDYGKVYKTYDGGLSWALSLDQYGLRTIELFDASVYVSGDFGAILKKDLTYDELISFDLLSVMSYTSAEAVVSVFIRSGLILENAELSIDLGLHSGIYDQTFSIETLNGFVGKSNEFEFTNLEANTTYYGRYKLTQGDKVAISDELSFTTQVVTGVEPDKKDQIKVYPNPADNAIRISIGNSSTRYQYEIKDIAGKIVTTSETSDEGMIDVSTINPGVYLLSVKHQGRLYIRRVILR